MVINIFSFPSRHLNSVSNLRTAFDTQHQTCHFPHYLRIEKQLTARLDFCGFAHISGSFILWGRGSLPLLRLLRGVIRYSPGSFSLLHPADSADYDLLLRALTQHLTSPIILFNIPLSCSDSSLNALRWQ